MSAFVSDPPFGPTSAAGSMASSTDRPLVLTGLMLAGLGLSGTNAFTADHGGHPALVVERTTAGASTAADAGTIGRTIDRLTRTTPATTGTVTVRP